MVLGDFKLLNQNLYHLNCPYLISNYLYNLPNLYNLLNHAKIFGKFVLNILANLRNKSFSQNVKKYPYLVAYFLAKMSPFAVVTMVTNIFTA